MLERIKDEFAELSNNPNANCGFTVGLVDDNSYFDWKISLFGPKDTSYKNGLFFLRIHFPPDYPSKPPEVYFITPIYHVNVNPCVPNEKGGEALGHVCISTLNWWKPEYKMKEVVLNIYSLFYMANPDSAYGVGRAQEYINNRDVYEEKVKIFTKKYANPLGANCDRNQNWDFNL
jgi:ubiquitin-conjugating enzyme E2 D/E